MLIQLHHQNRKTGETEFCAQTELPENLTSNEYNELRKAFVMDTKESHPLPNDKYIWLMCTEDSKDFLWAAKPN